MFKKTVSFNIFQLMTILLGVALLALLVSNRSLQEKIKNLGGKERGWQIVSAKELAGTLAKKNFFLVNVHTPYEGEIEKTDAFVKFDEIEKNLESLPKDKTGKIILYCKTGKMSKTAAEKLVSLGFSNVSHLEGGMEAWQKAGGKTFNVSELKKVVLPKEGVSLSVKWGNLGPTLVLQGVIDLEKFKKAVNPTEEELEILTSESSQNISINSENSQFVVDLLWAVGLAQKSKVYTEGPMGKEYKGEVGNFASTGGWTLAKGKATDYLNRHELFNLTSNQQDKVFEISKNIYRPCCGNPTSFPDCNHGMAALALVEIMVAEGWQDEGIYKAVLGFNSFWFPQTYIALAAYFEKQGISWDEVDAKKVLGQEFSSGQGAARISQEVGRLPYLFGTGSGSCGA